MIGHATFFYLCLLTWESVTPIKLLLDRFLPLFPGVQKGSLVISARQFKRLSLDPKVRVFLLCSSVLVAFFKIEVC